MKQQAKLFKYRPINVHTLRGLVAQTIYCAPPESFNDPYDCAYSADRKLHIFSIQFEKEAEKILQDQLDRASGKPVVSKKPIHNFTARVPKRKLSAVLEDDPSMEEKEVHPTAWGVCCFSHDPKGFPSDIAMWGHYADCHRGVCLEFSTAGDPFNETREVDYVTMLPEINHASFIKGDDGEKKKAFLTKYQRWHQEYEWRILSPKVGGSLPYKRELLTGVYFGTNTYGSDALMVQKIVGLGHTKYYTMGKADKEYALNAMPI
jgi:hypothetical protein